MQVQLFPKNRKTEREIKHPNNVNRQIVAQESENSPSIGNCVFFFYYYYFLT